MWKLLKFFITLFNKKLVKATHLLIKKTLNSSFHEIFFRWAFLTKLLWIQHFYEKSRLHENIFFLLRRVFFSMYVPQLQCEKLKLLSLNFFSSNQLISNFFSKTIAFTKFFEKSVRENFWNFHTVRLNHSNFHTELKGLKPWPYVKSVTQNLTFEMNMPFWLNLCDFNQ